MDIRARVIHSVLMKGKLRLKNTKALNLPKTVLMTRPMRWVFPFTFYEIVFGRFAANLSNPAWRWHCACAAVDIPYKVHICMYVFLSFQPINYARLHTVTTVDCVTVGRIKS